jgi:hypothetical protein
MEIEKTRDHHSAYSMDVSYLILSYLKKQNKYYLSKFRLKMKTIDEKNRISAICDSTYFLIIQSNF